MKITVVTVCRNAECVLENTIRSVYNQGFKDFEYLIIDGNSTDGTIDIVRKYKTLFSSKGIGFSFISEPDSGIYDAMNKSLKMAKGEWILFMNAGDCFYDENVLQNIFSIDYTGIDFVYGDVLLLENNKYKKAYIGSIDDLNDQSSICHQGSMTRLILLKDYKFDEEYKLAADYDLMLRMNRNHKVFKKIDCMIAIFSLGGASSKQSLNYLREMDKSRKRNGMYCPHKLEYYVMRLRIYNYMRIIGKTLLPSLFYSEKRGWYSDKFAILSCIDGKDEC